MRIALTITNGRIASLFETAPGLRVVTREGACRQSEDVALPGPSAAERVAQVLDTGADLVVTVEDGFREEGMRQVAWNGRRRQHDAQRCAFCQACRG